MVIAFHEGTFIVEPSLLGVVVKLHRETDILSWGELPQTPGTRFARTLLHRS
jgi:hypothetical protein